MIAYFDTSAVVPLLIEEAGSTEASRLWQEADRVASARIVYAEGHAALAQAARGGRIPQDELRTAVTSLVGLYEQLEVLEVSDALVRRAGALAEQLALRGFDSVHLAAAEVVNEEDLVFVAGDAGLCEAAERLGLRVARP